METQRIVIIAYRGNLGRLEDKYDDVRAQLSEANDKIVARESGIENRDSTIKCG